MTPAPRPTPETSRYPAAGGRGASTSIGAILRAFETTSYAIVVTDPTPRVRAVNPAFTKITGWTAADVIGKNPTMIGAGGQDAAFYAAMRRTLLRDGHWEGEVLSRHRYGAVTPNWLTIDVLRPAGGRVMNYVGVFCDIARRNNQERLLERSAFHDTVTGLPSRSLFHDRLQNVLNLARRKGDGLAVMALDLDGLKTVNDAHGRDAGDGLLTTVAGRLTACLRVSDTVARMGDDDFLVLCPDVGCDEHAVGVARRLADAVSRPSFIDRGSVSLGASVGVSLFPHHGENPKALIKAAGAAMERAKAAGENAIRVYELPVLPVPDAAVTCAMMR